MSAPSPKWLQSIVISGCRCFSRGAHQNFIIGVSEWGEVGQGNYTPETPHPPRQRCKKTSGNDQMFFTDQIIWSFSLFDWFVSFYKQESVCELSAPPHGNSLKHPANILALYTFKSLPFIFETSRQQHLKFPQVTGFIIIFSSSSFFKF